MKNIIVIGGGGHAISCADVILSKKEFKIFGFVDNIKKTTHKDFKIIGTDKDLNLIRKKIKYAFIGIGQIKTSKKRELIFNKLIKLNFSLPIISSKHSYISKNVKIGVGTILMHNVVVNFNSIIESNCIINTGSIIEHDCFIGKNSHIAPGAIINGGVYINSGTFIGSGTVIKQGVTIGKNCIISAGKYINKNISDNEIIK